MSDADGAQQGEPNLSTDEAAVRALVEAFGEQLQRDELLASPDVVSQSLTEQYGDYVTSNLLAARQADPATAPGRTVSSPWPDRIEVEPSSP